MANSGLIISSLSFLNNLNLRIPRTSYQLNHRSKKEKSTIEKQASISPVFPQQPIKNFKPLQKEGKESRGVLGKWVYVIKKINYLNDMVSEINLLSFLSSSVFNIKNTNKIRSPASH